MKFLEANPRVIQLAHNRRLVADFSSSDDGSHPIYSIQFQYLDGGFWKNGCLKEGELLENPSNEYILGLFCAEELKHTKE